MHLGGFRLTGLAIVAAAAGAVAWVLTAEAKDQGPRGSVCENHDKSSGGWRACVANAADDQQLFYAGYWLAKGGRYADALGYLQRIAKPDERVLTYIGFATRKQGDVDAAMPYYQRALAIAPGYTVARAYLGEAYLSKGDMARARAELAEIARRCGTNCAEHAELAAEIIAAERARS